MATLLIGELLTTTFFLLPFGLGAALAALANGLGANLALQWAVFVVISTLGLIFLRPLAKKITQKETPKTGVDRLVGLSGTIVEGGTNATSRARVDRDIWNVFTEDGSFPPLDSEVLVLSVEGNRLLVRVIKEALPKA